MKGRKAVYLGKTYMPHNQTFHKQTVIAPGGKSYKLIVSDVDRESGVHLTGYAMIAGKEHIVEAQIGDDSWRVVGQSNRYCRKDSQYLVSPDKRKKIMLRDNYTCQKCGANKDLAVDHIVPIRAGGDDSEDNLQVLCRSCNARKSAGPRADGIVVEQTTLAGMVYESRAGGLYGAPAAIALPYAYVERPEPVQIEVRVQTLEIPGHGLIELVFGMALVRRSYRRKPKPRPIKLVMSR